MSYAVFPDNTVLCNFAAVDRIDLLDGWLRGRGRWTEAVAREARASSRHLPGLVTVVDGSLLGEAIEIDDPVVISRVQRVRRVVFGGGDDNPLQHLGEAETCVLIAEVPEFAGSWWVTDDHDAYDYARGRQLTTRCTRDVLTEIVVDGDLAAEAAFALMVEMESHDRHLMHMPKSPHELG